MTQGSQLRAARGVFWAYVQNWSARGLSIITLLVLGRMLSPSDFGAFAIATVMLALAEILVEQGFSHAIVQRADLDQQHLNTAFWATLLVGGLLAVGTVCVAGPIARAYRHAEIEAMMIALAPVFIGMALASIPAALLRRELNYQPLAARAAVSNIASGYVAIVMAINGLGVWALVGQQLTYQLVGTAMLWCYESWRPTRSFSITHLKQLSTFSVQMVSIRLLEFAQTRVIELIIGATLGLMALGFYAMATRAYLAVTHLLAVPLWEAAISAFARLQRGRLATFRAFRNLTEFSALMVVPAFVILVGAAPALIPALFGAQWEGSILAFQVLCLLGVVRAFGTLNECLLQGSGLGGKILLVAVLRVLATMAAFIFLVRSGIAGVAGAMLIGQAVALPLSARFALQQSGCDVFLVMRRQAPLIAMAGVAGLISAFLSSSLTQQFGIIPGSLLSVVFASAGFVILVMLWVPRTVMAHLDHLPLPLSHSVTRILRAMKRV